MITEDYVSLEVAKLLKDKGFDETIHCFYFIDGTFIDNAFNTKNSYTRHYAAPTLQMTMKWLREVHNYLILIDVDDILEGYQWAIYYADSHQITPHSEFIDKSSYEEACEAAIKYCLKNLI